MINEHVKYTYCKGAVNLILLCFIYILLSYVLCAIQNVSDEQYIELFYMP